MRVITCVNGWEAISPSILTFLLIYIIPYYCQLGRSLYRRTKFTFFMKKSLVTPLKHIYPFYLQNPYSLPFLAIRLFMVPPFDKSKTILYISFSTAYSCSLTFSLLKPVHFPKLLFYLFSFFFIQYVE